MTAPEALPSFFVREAGIAVMIALVQKMFFLQEATKVSLPALSARAKLFQLKIS